MKTYKGFDENLKCRDFQYEVGEEYEQSGEVKCCNSGFHACERPLDVFSYYPPGTSRYCEVEQGGQTRKDNEDTKVASSKIKIGAEIGIPGLVKAQIEYVKAHTTTEHTDPEKATAGDSGAATAGNSGAATAGNWGFALSGGNSLVGKRGVAVAKGTAPKAKGGFMATLVLVLTDSGGEPIITKTGTVDEHRLKSSTWYTLKDGEFAEVGENV